MYVFHTLFHAPVDSIPCPPTVQLLSNHVLTLFFQGRSFRETGRLQRLHMLNQHRLLRPKVWKLQRRTMRLPP